MKIANIYDGVVVKVARNGELVYELSIGILSAHGRQWNWAAKEVAHIEGRDCAEIWLGALQVIAVLVKMLNKEQVIHPDSKGDSYTMDSIPQLLHILHAHGHAFAALLKISQGVFTNHVKCVTVQPSVVMETEAVPNALEFLNASMGDQSGSVKGVAFLTRPLSGRGVTVIALSNINNSLFGRELHQTLIDDVIFAIETMDTLNGTNLVDEIDWPNTPLVGHHLLVDKQDGSSTRTLYVRFRPNQYTLVLEAGITRGAIRVPVMDELHGSDQFSPGAEW